MTIEIANRLVKLRKEKGYSQEQLADALGISRQAVSKWERAEASPDTDNLICLAKLYGISLDELLATDQSIEDIAKEEKEHNDNKGIYIKDDTGTVEVVNKSCPEENNSRNKRFKKIEAAIIPSLLFIVLVTYVLLGAFLNMWSTMWVLFIYWVALISVPKAIFERSVTKFAYPIFITALYLTFGLFLQLWHPTWVLFITIPIFYIVFGLVESIKNKKEN